jgi:hypothetical protein
VRRVLALVAVLLSVATCNRAALRIPGAAGAFHPAVTNYQAASAKWGSVRVAAPLDERPKHYGERVAGTRWKACETDPFWNNSMPVVVGRELQREIDASRLFQRVVASGTEARSLVLETRVHAFCAQAIGFLFVRAAGISSLHYTLRDGDEIVFDRAIERVVTDADDAYTGAQATTVEQAMKVLLSDSLRENLRGLFAELEKSAPAS